jgi:hypothetical protein
MFQSSQCSRINLRASSQDGEQAADDREQRDAFDERCGEDHLSLDGRCHLWLASGRLDCTTTDATDAETRADDGEACTDGCKTSSEWLARRSNRGGFNTLREDWICDEGDSAEDNERKDLAHGGHIQLSSK